MRGNSPKTASNINSRGNIMKFTKEQIRKAMACKTADELLALAKSEGVALTREQAEEYIAQMGDRELTDKELAQVVGGDCLGLDLDKPCPNFNASCPVVSSSCQKDKK